MNDRFAGVSRRARATLEGFTAGQRTVTVLVAIGMLVGGIMFSQWASRPSYTPLFSNLSSSDASAITSKLSAKKVSYRLTDGGSTILVPDGQVYQLRLDMSAANLPSGGAQGYSLLDKQGITTSDFQQHVQYQRALEGELTRTIEALDGVQGAVVHLAIPDQSVFATDSQKPTASVLVKTTPGQALTADQVQAVVHLVSSSVAGLDPNNVTVADASGHVLNTAGVSGTLASAGDTRAQQTQAFEDRMSQSLQQMVDQVVGPGHSVVRVSADLNYDQTDTTTERFLQPDKNAVPLSVASTKEQYTGTGTGAAGVLGPDNNGVPAATGSGNNRYQREQVTQDNAIGKVTEQVQSAPGAVRRMSVAVLLDERTAGTVDTNRLQTLVSNAAGLVAARGDSVAVDRMAFDTTAAKQAATELAKADKARKTQSMMSLAKTGGLIVLVLVVLAAVLRRSGRRPTVEALPAARLAELEEARRLLAMREFALENADRPALPAAMDEATTRRIAVHEEIGTLVENQPDEVAQLLRGWLADRRA